MVIARFWIGPTTHTIDIDYLTPKSKQAAERLQARIIKSNTIKNISVVVK